MSSFVCFNCKVRVVSSFRSFFVRVEGVIGMVFRKLFSFFVLFVEGNLYLKFFVVDVKENFFGSVL